jgi:hypothetical protein
MATSPAANPTPITPPRVPLIDPRTDLIAREWYLFFLSLFRSAENNDSPNLAPVSQDLSGDFANLYDQAQLASMMARYDDCCRALEQQIGTLPSAVQLAELVKEVEALQLLPPPRGFKRSRYGSFYDTTTQTATVINTATAITFNTTDLSRGVTLGSPTSRVTVDTEGIYNFQTSIQLDSTVATGETFYLWFRLNGVDVTNSASQARVQGNNAEVFLALNYFFNLKAGDYVELMFSVTNLGVQLLASGAVAPHPGIPSIILTVSNNIGGIES